MASWISGGGSVSDTYSTSHGNTDTYGTRSPVISPEFQDWFKRVSGSVNASGANPTQQGAIDWFSGNLASNPVRGATTAANTDLGLVKKGLNDVGASYVPFMTQEARQVGAVPTATAGMASTPTPVTAASGADYINRYMSPFTNDVVDTTLSDLQKKYADTVNTSKMAAAAGGAYGGGRQGVFDANNADNYLRNVAGTSATLRNLGFTQALNPATADASRGLAADQGNQGVAADLSKFNAGSLTDVSKFNAGNAADIAKFNVNAGYAGDQQKIQAADKLRETAGQIAGVSQQVLQNVITENGIDMEAAQSLLAAGALTQDQLNQILQMAQNFNGYDFTQNTNTSAASNSLKTEAHGDINIGT